MNYIAHIRKSDRVAQTIEEHLHNVRKRAEFIGNKIGITHIAGLAGMLHDMGKYSEQFQTYIRKAADNPDSPPTRGSVDHSTAGGKFLHKYVQRMPRNQHLYMLSEIVGNSVISHHSYLHDYLSLDLESPYLSRVRDKPVDDLEDILALFYQRAMTQVEIEEYIKQAAAELVTYLRKNSMEHLESKLLFLTKYVFSALVDADHTDARLFEENEEDDTERQESVQLNRFQTYYERLICHINDLQESPYAQTAINRLRRAMSDQCDQFARRPSGIYTLSIPTGGGKTLASLRYALKHALEFKKKHIIYVVPYTTIIEQNADEVRRIVEDRFNVLEDHSNVVDNTDEEDDEFEDGIVNVGQKLRLAKDNWDAPIIFTTMVQFLNILYAKGYRNVRRLHNLTEAVIVFDEVQKVPVHCISLFNRALNLLKDFGYSSLILCTATQPALGFVDQQLDLSEGSEIISDLHNISDEFKRVEVIDLASEESYNTVRLAQFVVKAVQERGSVLVVLNTKTVVKRLYQELANLQAAAAVYHLSTGMCAAHRKGILDKVRQHLDDKEPVVCVSTQLIEAGVDISFNCVIRSLAGLDSIAQAAGRCNRHREYKLQNVYIIDHAEEKLSNLPEIAEGKKITLRMLKDLKREANCHGGHVLSVQAMEHYFKAFYTAFQIKLNYFIPSLQQNMTDLLYSPRKTRAQAYKHNREEPLSLFNVNSYRTGANNFRVIDSPTTSVIVPFDEEGKKIIACLNGSISISNLSKAFRKAQRYTVNLFDHELKQLEKDNALIPLLEGNVLALKETAYNEDYGVNIENNGEWGLYLW
ncbi:CRISPR-associated helicase Cas3' [Paenibacillus sp. MMS18-CY102]|uniref:CRISPR-associated helicase Cas3' n=1 Tax=Paenibacillus sp. MMS18-CY102 TaxID=2682849 RepID=UPI0013656ED5|nr:CRISPR-associated helicase Cas3' [Paenibacillus sp. MMS18-CY102]MWC27863.1 CRISPR-associated helicase Cas3' [Paenibacillus sp. MMS18-CY102]